MLHLRVIVPADRVEPVVGFLVGHPGSFDVVRTGGVVSGVPGSQVVTCNLVRPAANDVLGWLREQGLERDGSITVGAIDAVLSRTAEEAEDRYSSDTVVWDELGAQVTRESRWSWSYLAFQVIATLLAGIGIVTDSTIIIVGAMVLGPDFGPMAAICFGLVGMRLHLMRTGARTLLVGYFTGFAVTCAVAQVSYWVGWYDESILKHATDIAFISQPDRWSFATALLAGAAGQLSATSERSFSLVGVFISVTTVPACASAAVAIPLGEWHLVAGSGVQLGMNLCGMIAAGFVTLLLLRMLADRYGLRLRVPPEHPARPV